MLSDYPGLFPGATREKPRFKALAEAVLRQAAELITVTEQMPAARSLEYAEGAQLDQLAAGAGLCRADSPGGVEAADEDFRAFVREKLALWRTDGTNGSA